MYQLTDAAITLKSHVQMSTMDLDCAELETVMAALLYDSARRRPLLFSRLEVVLFVFSFALASGSVIQVLIGSGLFPCEDLAVIC